MGVAPVRQQALHSAVISWGLDRGFNAEFDMPGTRDPSPHLSAPAAIAYMRQLGMDAVRNHNHALAWSRSATPWLNAAEPNSRRQKQ